VSDSSSTHSGPDRSSVGSHASADGEAAADDHSGNGREQPAAAAATAGKAALTLERARESEHGEFDYEIDFREIYRPARGLAGVHANDRMRPVALN
jgi:hypothetical protein